MLDFCIKDFVSERSAVKSLQSNMWFLLGMFRCEILQVNSPSQKIGGGNVAEVYGVHSFPRLPSVSPEGRFSVFRGKSTVGVVAFDGEGILTTENTETRFAGHGRRLMKGVVPLLQPRFHLVVVDENGLEISVTRKRAPRGRMPIHIPCSDATRRGRRGYIARRIFYTPRPPAGLTRSTWRHGDTESDFEADMRALTFAFTLGGKRSHATERFSPSTPRIRPHRNLVKYLTGKRGISLRNVST